MTGYAGGGGSRRRGQEAQPALSGGSPEPGPEAVGLEHPAIGTAGLAAAVLASTPPPRPRLPLAAFSSVNSLSEAASLPGPCQGLPGTAAHYSSAPNAGHSYLRV